MALVQVNFISKMLSRTVTFNAIIPLDKISFGEEEVVEAKPLKTLYLLHGAFGNYTDYLSGTRIQRWAEEHNLAVIMPSGENQFYVDKPSRGENYGAYVADELVEFTRKMFPLSHKKEDTFIAGLSMGGYGALINGLKYHETFSRIGAFSPGLMIDDIASRSELLSVTGWSMDFYDNAFGGIDTIKNSDKDYYYLIDQLIENKKEIPKIYLPIGKDDFLLESVRGFKSFVDKREVPLTYIEDDGGHEWDFWDKYVKNFLEWLPLEEKGNYLNSGNVAE
ncbi:alpha/beta hydrolase family protein [Vagococcus fluvialis]|uniref:alpha/beta hydrolase n=1 Tax=Vagococcus fluvialis TaxID=2738 RepID=UPI00288D62A7|nr:alpha/beta hydrolase family protein [Vagococcus fluvialis]MDT2780796.1 alpha/beta hydrolase family protein [Vagococcus fluvialis]